MKIINYNAINVIQYILLCNYNKYNRDAAHNNDN